MPKLRGVSDEGADFLGRYAEEVALLASGLGQLQAAMSEVYGRVLASGAGEDLQRLDAFTQTAETLASIAGKLVQEPSLDRDAVAMLVSNVKLADVAARLVGGDKSDLHWEAGDIEVF